MATSKRTLLLDYDDVHGVPHPDHVQHRIERAGHAVDEWKERPSPSGRGLHVRIKLVREMTPMERVAMQAICGSDPVREAFNVQRVRTLYMMRDEHAREVATAEFWGDRYNVLYTPEE